MHNPSISILGPGPDVMLIEGFDCMVLYGVRIKLPTFIYLLFRLFTAQAFIRRKDYISEFPYILTTLYEFYMNVDMQVICCTITSVLSPISAPLPLHRHRYGGKR